MRRAKPHRVDDVGIELSESGACVKNKANLLRAFGADEDRLYDRSTFPRIEMKVTHQQAK